MVASALQISQAALLAEQSQRKTLFLIDDAGAELDAVHNQQFFGLLGSTGGQVLATSTQHPDALESIVQMIDVGRSQYRTGTSDESNTIDVRVFHVEHGAIQGV